MDDLSQYFFTDGDLRLRIKDKIGCSIATDLSTIKNITAQKF